MKRILIVDPDCSGESLASVLGRHGYISLITPTGGKALELLRSGHDLDMVIMEMLLPDMPGLDLLSEIRRERPGLPVVIVTGRVSIETYLHAISMGATEYLNKPVMSREISHIVKNVLDRPGTSFDAA